jgi:hypothetical protein
MGFIKVTATQCNAQGQTSGQSMPVEMHLNSDLIGAFRGSEVLLKAGNVLHIGDSFFTKFRIVQGEKIPLQQ